MCAKEVKTRDQIDKKYKWNIEDMYASDELWEKDYAEALKAAEAYGRFEGTLANGAGALLEALAVKDEVWQKIERVYVYARQRRDEDNRVTKYQAMCDRTHALIAKASAAMSFFTPELLSIPEETVLGFIDSEPGLGIYRHAITDVLREKAHVLSPAEENLMAQLGELFSATNDIFTMLNNADMKFGRIRDENGDEVELTHGNYIAFLESRDREVRRQAFEHMYAAYIGLINTISTSYNYNTKTDVIGARVRKYPSALEAALSSDNIPVSVYDSLISSVHKSLPALHKYMAVRKKLLGVDELHMYDVYVPLIETKEDPISFEDAVMTVREALKPLGGDYLSRMNAGIAAGWIDVCENVGKTSGAYSFGSYDSMPYILLNWSDKLNDVFTLIHEMGHSMHSDYTRESQPFVYGSHSIFTAETASTVNENLLMKYLLRTNKDPEMRKYLLNKYIEEFRTTLFRQTMFAEFERITHAAVESGEVLTAEWMNDQYRKLNEQYFGPDVVIDKEIEYEWARIPHFYNAFYVYKYATGYSAASAISERILTQGESAAADYIRFLRTGESDYPIELLRIAGVDMDTEGPVNEAMATFEKLVDEFASLV